MTDQHHTERKKIFQPIYKYLLSQGMKENLNKKETVAYISKKYNPRFAQKILDLWFGIDSYNKRNIYYKQDVAYSVDCEELTERFKAKDDYYRSKLDGPFYYKVKSDNKRYINRLFTTILTLAIIIFILSLFLEVGDLGKKNHDLVDTIDPMKEKKLPNFEDQCIYYNIINKMKGNDVDLHYEKGGGNVLEKLHGGDLVCVYAFDGAWGRTDRGWLKHDYLSKNQDKNTFLLADVDGDGRNERLEWRFEDNKKYNGTYKMRLVDDNGEVLWSGPDKSEYGNSLVPGWENGVYPALLKDIDGDGKVELLMANVIHEAISPGINLYRWNGKQFIKDEWFYRDLLLEDAPHGEKLTWTNIDDKAYEKDQKMWWVSDLEQLPNGDTYAIIVGVKYPYLKPFYRAERKVRFNVSGASIEISRDSFADITRQDDVDTLEEEKKKEIESAKKEQDLINHQKMQELLSEGKNYYYGKKGVRKNYAKAEKAFLEAVENEESGEAYRYLGVMYLFGNGVDVDISLAEDLLKEGKKLGDERAEELYECYIDHAKKTKFKVMNLPKKDKLTVRTGPFSSTAKTDALRNKTSGIVILDMSTNKDGTKWAKIRYCRNASPKYGWVASRYLVPAYSGYSSVKDYKVVNVSSGDTLNIRKGPGSEFRKVAEIPSFANKIKLKKCKNSTRGGRWCKIHYGLVKGWVSALYLQQE